MKVLYIARVGKKLHGVSNKINNTLSTWKIKGLDTQYYNSMSRPRSYRLRIFSTLNTAIELFQNYIFDYQLYQTIKNFKPEVIYWRFGPIPILQNFNKKTQIILESNSNILEEKRHRSFIQQLLIEVYRIKFNKVCSGIVGVTPDCMSGFKKIKHKAVIGNSISFDNKLFNECLSSYNLNKPSAVFLGSPNCPWHGVDKLIDISRANPNINFTVVGYSQDQFPSYDENLPENLIFKGYLTDEALSSELKSATFALGSLAMERAGMKYSSSLKNRQYLQHALPIIIQGEDLELNNCPAVISIPISFNKDDVSKAISNILNIELDRIDITTIRECIDSNYIEKDRINFLRSVKRDYII